MAVYSDTKQLIATSFCNFFAIDVIKNSIKILIERGNCGSHVLGDLSEDLPN